MTFTDVGWIVVHSLWQGAGIAGIASLVLALVHPSRARARYVIAWIFLALMILVPTAAASSGLTAIRWRMRPQTMAAIDGAIGYPAVIWWGSIVIPIVGVLWMLGVLAGAIRMGIEIRRARALRREELSDVAEDVQRAVHGLSASICGPKTVEVRTSGRAPVPMMLGWRRPMILLPASAPARLRPAEMRAILAHELAHVRRGDYQANLVLIVIDALLFHHPGARWLSGCIRAEREYCCDDDAVRESQDALEYAQALASLEDARADCRFAVAARSGTLLDRIRRIAGHPRRVMTPLRGTLVLLAAIAVAAAIFTAAMVVPPSLPFGTEIRRRSAQPPQSRVTGDTGARGTRAADGLRKGRSGPR